MPAPINKVLFSSILIVAMRASIIACKFGLAIFIGRYLDLSSLGLYGLAAGAVSLGPVVIGMGMVHLIMRDAVTLSLRQVTIDLRHYWSFTTSVYALVLTCVVLIAITFGASELWSLVIVIMLFEHFGNDVFQLLSNLERPLLANVSAFLRGAAWILIYVPIAIWEPSFRSNAFLFEFWLGGSVSAFLLFVWASRSWPWKAAFSFPFKRAWITTTIKKAFVIYVSDLSFVGSLYLDRYLVTLFLGLQLAGVYFLYWSAAAAVTTFVSIAVLQIQRPRLIKAYHDGGAPAHQQLTTKFMKTTISATAVFSVAVGCAFYVVLPFLKQPSAADYQAAFWLIMAGMGMRNIADFGAMALFTSRRDKIMTFTNLAAVIVLTIAQVLLLPISGLYGAGAAILFTFSAITLWRYKLLFSPASSGTQSRPLF
ncbi:lipopolysaccharide biosynthesis protein [Bradyrhizobium sp. URHD0069]|uniref:lipopolysaccharide biosynthesis protein n=1 Tax=Bradyrhizobium sp. URHD0069 TaxID=1380355 RepID=UPI001FD99BDB|nr:polysaccharide biosynthesis protein [Bradyrhizobium sp. URHD0069]